MNTKPSLGITVAIEMVQRLLDKDNCTLTQSSRNAYYALLNIRDLLIDVNYDVIHLEIKEDYL